jgi:phage terminase large subunit
MLDCLALKNPDNTVKAMARAILQLLRHWKHTGHVYVCGDSTSQKDDVKQEKGFDLFRLLITELDEVKPIRRVSKSNPNVRPSADFFNAILAYNEQGISFVVDESCRVAILDFENTKEDKNGKVDKKTVLDPVTKVSYQPYGHIVDLTRYLLTSVFASQYARFQTGIIKPLVVVGKDAEWKSASRF